MLLPCKNLIIDLSFNSPPRCSANITSQDMGKVTSFKDMCTFGLKYMCNYLFAVYLIVMAELEKSALHSLFYSISAVVSFSKVSFSEFSWPTKILSLGSALLIFQE